jgi:hypothetical protein
MLTRCVTSIAEGHAAAVTLEVHVTHALGFVNEEQLAAAIATHQQRGLQGPAVYQRRN